MTPERLRDEVIHALEDRKARDIVTIDVSKTSAVTDYMVIACGTSSRHVLALIDHVLDCAKAAGAIPLGVEGRDTAEWVLLDLGDVVVHVMQQQAREFYDLERLWGELPGARQTLP
jgi:ribosome-associated protein